VAEAQEMLNTSRAAFLLFAIKSGDTDLVALSFSAYPDCHFMNPD
jgi:hypothetical protein